MATKEFIVRGKYYDQNGDMRSVDYDLKYTHSNGVTTSIGAGNFIFNPDLMSLPLPTSASTDAEIELAVRDSNGGPELDGPDHFHQDLLDHKAMLESYTLDDECCEDCIRAKRNRLIAETDWWASSDLTMTQAQIDYRQALRDITSQAGFPESVTWPVKP